MKRTPVMSALTRLHTDHSRDGQMCWCGYRRWVTVNGHVVERPGHTPECLYARKVLRPYWRSVTQRHRRLGRRIQTRVERESARP